MKKIHSFHHKGFTLIELLVVVAIIALLAATILASLGSARTKARDARTTSELSSMRAQAELFNNDNGFSYGTATTSCGTAGATAVSAGTLFTSSSADSVYSLIQDVLINASGGGTSTNGDVTCNVSSSPTSWAVSAKLQGGAVFCVDSNGTSKQEPSSILTSATAISSGHCN